MSSPINKAPERAVESATRYNEALDERLRQSGRVEADLFRDFKSVQDDPNASAVGWLVAKLNVLAARVDAGSPVFLYQPQTHELRSVATRAELVEWAALHVPVADFGR
jgi:hypothetical protein